MNATGTFMQIMSHLMREYLGEFVCVYIDYILIFSNKADERAHGAHQKGLQEAAGSALLRQQTEIRVLLS